MLAERESGDGGKKRDSRKGYLFDSTNAWDELKEFELPVLEDLVAYLAVDTLVVLAVVLV